jgi:hypothetical protein
MPEQDNVSMEKISLSTKDFMEDSDNFGIQDTQILASKDLQSFLLTDPSNIQDVNEEKDEEDVFTNSTNKQAPAQKQQQKSEDTNDTSKQTSTQKQTTQKKDDESKKPDGKETLDNFLFGKEDEQDQNTQTTNIDPKNAAQSTEDDTYTTLSRDLMRLGVFSKNSDDETEETIDVKTPEQFLERFSLEKKKGAIAILDNFLSQFGEDYRKMFDAVFVNAVSPQEYLTSFSRQEALGNLDMSSEDNQERVVRSYYKSLKWDDNKIETRIQKVKDYGDLEEEAKTYQEVLLNKEKEVTAELERKKLEELKSAKDKELASKKSYQKILVEKLKAQELDGIPLTDKEAVETLDYLTEKKYKLASGELLSEFDKDLMELNKPENHELKVKLGLLLKKKLDLTSVKKSTLSKESGKLFNLSAKNAKNGKNEKEVKSFF